VLDLNNISQIADFIMQEFSSKWRNLLHYHKSF
jgi:hypothetical protein